MEHNLREPKLRESSFKKISRRIYHKLMGVNHTTNLANSGESLILTGTDAITRVEKMLDGKELVKLQSRSSNYAGSSCR